MESHTSAELEKQDVRLVWNAIKPGIEKIHSGLPWQDWNVNDVYRECIDGTAAVFAKKGGLNPGDSFGVCRLNMNKNTGERTLFIWIAWSPEEMGAESIKDDMKRLALSQGCTAIEFETSEEKLVEYAKGFGFDKVMYRVYRSLT